MTSINIRDANQNFSALLRRVEHGETIEIKRRGKPVARISPAQADAGADPKREAAYAAMLDLLKAGPALPHFTVTDSDKRER